MISTSEKTINMLLTEINRLKDTLAEKDAILEVIMRDEAQKQDFPNLTAKYACKESLICEGVRTRATVKPSGLAVTNIFYRQFNLKFGILSSTDMDTLWAFYIQQSGQFKPFIFTSHRDSQQYLVRFVHKVMSRTMFEYLLGSTGLNLIAVIEEKEDL